MKIDKGIWRQRLGYGVSDFSCNLIWNMITLYLMYYYTDVMGLPSVSVGMLFLVTRIFDGIADTCMGVIIDKTRTRWGKSRPYFLFGAIPFGLLSILAFYVPDIGETGKLIYAYITYLGLSIAYTMVNIPMASILPSLTSDPNERTNLATTRIIFSFIGATAVSAGALSMVKFLGNGSQAHGFFWTMVIFSVVGTFFFFVTFKNVEEKVHISTDKITIKQAFSALKGNGPWFIFALNIIFMWGAYFFQQGAIIYYFTYNVGRPDLASVVASIGTFIPIIGTFATPFFAKKMYKRSLFEVASAINLAGMIIMLIANLNVVGLIAGATISALGHGLRQSIYFSMQADPVDYGEWKNGVNAAGILSSLNGFIGKIAMAGAGSISGLLLSWGHYVPHHTQTTTALFAIKLNYLIIPIIFVAMSMIIMAFYNLDKIYGKIRADIDSRKKANDSLDADRKNQKQVVTDGSYSAS